MGCDLINKEKSKWLFIKIRDYDTGEILGDFDVKIEDVKRISYEIYGDGVIER